MADHRTVIEVGHLASHCELLRGLWKPLVVSYDGRKVTTYTTL